MERIRSSPLVYCASSIRDLLNAKEQVVSDYRNIYLYISAGRSLVELEEIIDELPFPLNRFGRLHARLGGYRYGKHHGAIVAVPQVKLTEEKGSKFLMVSDNSGLVQMEIIKFPEMVKSPSDILVGAGYTTARNQSDIFTVIDIDTGLGFNFEKLFSKSGVKAFNLSAVLG